MPTEERILALHEQSLTLVEKIKAAKQQQGKTIQQLADETGIPRTTLNRFFAGTLMNPGFMDVCALCASLELSADELIGLSPQKSDDSVTVDFLQLELDHKDEMLQEKDAAISRLFDRSRIQEAGISARDTRIRKQSDALSEKDSALASAQREDKPLIYGQCALNILLAVVLIIYMVLDARNTEMGLIRSEKISAVILFGAAGIAAVFMLTAFLIFHKLLSGGERNGKKKEGAGNQAPKN